MMQWCGTTIAWSVITCSISVSNCKRHALIFVCYDNNSVSVCIFSSIVFHFNWMILISFQWPDLEHAKKIYENNGHVKDHKQTFDTISKDHKHINYVTSAFIIRCQQFDCVTCLHTHDLIMEIKIQNALLILLAWKRMFFFWIIEWSQVFESIYC